MLGPARADDSSGVLRTQDVIYGRKVGVALTMDVFQSKQRHKGIGIISLVSGGWISNHDEITSNSGAIFLDRGYTVFMVVHGSQPKFTIPEAIQDIHRAVRFIRHNAAEWGVDPNHLGITGGSAGGHLSLILGTQGGPGAPDAKDPIDRESSAVQAVACFYPPSDFLNYGADGEDAVGVGRLAHYRPAFGLDSDSPEGRQRLGREISPYNFITAAMPPTLIVHGDADATVPLQQSERFVRHAVEMGAIARLVIVPGAGHGQQYMTGKKVLIADWFDQYLRGIRP